MTNAGNCLTKRGGWLLLLLGTMVWIVGCETTPLQLASKSGKQPGLATNVTFSSGAWAVVQNRCQKCHNGFGGNVIQAGIDLTDNSVPSTYPDLIVDAVSTGKAPAVGHPLAGAELDTLLIWCQDRGADTTGVIVPSSFAWSLATQIGSDANGTNFEGAGETMVFGVEDYRRPDSMIVKTLGGIKGIGFWNQSLITPASMFTGSTHRVSYIIPDGVAWNGRMRTGYVKGWFRVNRWAGYIVHATKLERGADSTVARNQRDYIRVQNDRDWISITIKKVGDSGTLETYPWTNASSDLQPYSGYSLNASVFLLDSVNYWSRLDITHESGNTVYDYVVYDDDHDSNPSANVLAHVKGYRSGTDHHGSFCYVLYSEDGTTSGGAPKFRWWGNTEVYATNLYGAGGRVGGCKKNCQELD